MKHLFPMICLLCAFSAAGCRGVLKVTAVQDELGEVRLVLEDGRGSGAKLDSIQVGRLQADGSRKLVWNISCAPPIEVSSYLVYGNIPTGCVEIGSKENLIKGQTYEVLAATKSGAIGSVQFIFR